MGIGSPRRSGNRGSGGKPVVDPVRQALEEHGIGVNNVGDRQVANVALSAVLDALPEDLRQALQERQITLALPAIPGPKGADGAEARDWRFGLRKGQTLEQGVAETLNRQLANREGPDGKPMPATQAEIANALQYAIDSVGDASVAEALGLAAGRIGANRYQVGMDTFQADLQRARENPELQALIAEQIGLSGGTPASPAPVATAGAAGWMGQRPELLAKVPVLQEVNNGQLALAGSGIGGAGLAFLLDYLTDDDDRSAMAAAPAAAPAAYAGGR